MSEYSQEGTDFQDFLCCVAQHRQPHVRLESYWGDSESAAEPNFRSMTHGAFIAGEKYGSQYAAFVLKLWWEWRIEARIPELTPDGFKATRTIINSTWGDHG